MAGDAVWLSVCSRAKKKLMELDALQIETRLSHPDTCEMTSSALWDKLCDTVVLA